MKKAILIIVVILMVYLFFKNLVPIIGFLLCGVIALGVWLYWSNIKKWFSDLLK